MASLMSELRAQDRRKAAEAAKENYTDTEASTEEDE